MIWPVVLGVGDVEVDRRGRRRRTARRGRRCRARSCRPGTLVKSTIRSARSARPISSRLPLVGGEVHRGGQEAALVADLPDLDARDVAEVEDQEARLAAVEEAEAVAALLDGLERPGVAVDHDHVAEELGVPDRRNSVSGMYGARRCPSKNARRVRVEERAVGVERAVLDGDRDLVVGLVRAGTCRPPSGAGPGQHGRRAGAAVEHRLVACGAAADEVEARRARRTR